MYDGLEMSVFIIRISTTLKGGINIFEVIEFNPLSVALYTIIKIMSMGI